MRWLLQLSRENYKHHFIFVVPCYQVYNTEVEQTVVLKLYNNIAASVQHNLADGRSTFEHEMHFIVEENPMFVIFYQKESFLNSE